MSRRGYRTHAGYDRVWDKALAVKARVDAERLAFAIELGERLVADPSIARGFALDRVSIEAGKNVNQLHYSEVANV